MSIYLKAFLILIASASFAALAVGIVSFFYNLMQKHPVTAKILCGTTFALMLYLVILFGLTK